MFYCDPCGERRGWPTTIFRSFGPCELCRRTRECSDMPSKFLPLPPKNAQVGRLFTHRDYPDEHLRVIKLVRSGRVYHADALVADARWDGYFDIAKIDERVTAWVGPDDKHAPCAPHICPFGEDVNGSTALCACCTECVNICTDEI